MVPDVHMLGYKQRSLTYRHVILSQSSIMVITDCYCIFHIFTNKIYRFTGIYTARYVIHNNVPYLLGKY